MQMGLLKSDSKLHFKELRYQLAIYLLADEKYYS